MQMRRDPDLSPRDNASAPPIAVPATPATAGSWAWCDRPLTAAVMLGRVVVVALVTTLLLFAAAAWQHREQVLREAARDLSQTARILEEHALKVIGSSAATKLRELSWLIQAVGWEGVATDERIHRRMVEMMDAPEMESIWLLDEMGQLRATTMAFPAPRLDLSHRDYYQIHRDREGEDSLYVGRVLLGAIHGRSFFPVSIRVTDAQGEFLGVAQISLRPGYFHDFYSAIQSRPKSVVALVGADGHILVREPTPAGRPDQLMEPSDFMEYLGRSFAGTFRFLTTFDDVERLYAYRKVAGMPLYVVVGAGVADLTEKWLYGVAVYAAFALPALIAVAGLGWVAYRRTLEMEQAQHKLAEINAHLEERVIARTRELETSLAQKEILLREVHHRVKNNMQVVASLLRLQATQGCSSEDALRNTLKRIQTMGMLHERLYQSLDLARIDLGAFLRDLCDQAADAYAASERGIRWEVDAEPVMLDLDQAIPVALITNEVLSNAFKHAFPGGREGAVRVELARRSGMIRLQVHDDGIGADLPPPDLKRSLGLVLVQILTQQLGGTYRFEAGEGLTFHLSFPAPECRAREIAADAVPTVAPV